jgi:putative RecB family exonuclease
MKFEELIERFKEIGTLSTKDKVLKRKYSITGDIISFLICPRQYGFYKHLRYLPSNPTQEWFGNVIHQMLKRIHSFFESNKRLPDENEIETLFITTENNLRVHGIVAGSEKARETALKVIKKFTEIEGESFFKNVEATEFQLVKEYEDFILYGIVDVLRGGNSFEIWDYKGMRRPDERTEEGKKKIDRYRKQMFVYGYLFYLKNGDFPKRAILYFMNELLKAERKRPESALYVVDFTDKSVRKEVEKFMAEFSNIVREIEKCIEENNWHLPETIDIETCSRCDFRWDCPKASGKFSAWELP